MNFPKTKRKSPPLNGVVSTGRRPFTLFHYKSKPPPFGRFSPLPWRWLKAPAFLFSSLGSFRRSSVGLPVSNMNHFIVQQNTFISCEETRGFASISDLKDPVVCPKPRRLAILANNHIKQPLRWHQTELCDSKAGADLLDIILKKGSEQSSPHVASSPPFFSGSPPSRASNPLIQDARFGDEKLSPMPALPAAYSPSSLSSPSSASSAHKGGGCARMKFGLKPAAVRVEGFDCLSRDRQNSRIPAVA